MKISIKKLNKVMHITRRKTKSLNITIKDEIIEEIEAFKYLGSSQIEKRKRIAMGKQDFMKRKSLLTKHLNEI